MKIGKLLAVSSCPLLLEGMVAVFSVLGFDVLKAGSIQEAVCLAEENPDIGLMMIDMTTTEEFDSTECFSRIRSLIPTLRSVIYAAKDKIWRIPALLCAEVDGIVMENDDIEEMVLAVTSVWKGAAYRSPIFLECFESIKNLRDLLSHMDIAVLQMISEGMPTAGISKKVNLSEKSIEYHRSNIIKKLGSKNMPEAIHKAVKLGII